MYHVCVWKLLWASSRLNEYVSCGGIRKSVGTKNLLSLSLFFSKILTKKKLHNISHAIFNKWFWLFWKGRHFRILPKKLRSWAGWCWLTRCWCFFICFHSYFMVSLLSSSFRIIRRCCVHFFFSLFDVVFFFFLLLSFFRLSIFSSICCCCCCCIFLHLFYYSMDFAGWIKYNIWVRLRFSLVKTYENVLESPCHCNLFKFIVCIVIFRFEPEQYGPRDVSIH